MNPADALDISQAAIWTVLLAASPPVVSAMLVGIAIALLQALTQVQELTLTFVPKIVAILLVSALTAPFVGAVIFTFAEQTYARIPKRVLIKLEASAYFRHVFLRSLAVIPRQAKSRKKFAHFPYRGSDDNNGSHTE